MNQAAVPEEGCGVFGGIEGPGPGQLLRFIVGEGLAPQEMSSTDIETQLGDPFATLLLLKGNFPTTADEVLSGIDAASPEGDPLRVQQSFLLGEDGQLGIQTGEIESTNRSIRFLVARGSAPHGPELVISASHPHQGLVELMAWDVTHGGFNYYRTLRGAGGWVWAGNSRHALAPATRGKGPFESHPSGNLIMRELKFPWVHWHSFKAQIRAEVFDPADARREHRWFQDKGGAETCETAVVMPSIVRWTNARFESIAAGTTALDQVRLIEHIATTPTVNLASSATESAAAKLGSTVDLPPSFFVDSEALQAVGLPSPPPLSVPSAFYVSSLETFGFRLSDGQFAQPGDTHFAFLVPERAFEDNEVLRQAIARSILSRRLVATILMVDFPNPVFSRRRSELVSRVQGSSDAGTGLSEGIAASIVAASEQSGTDSPERDFAARWALADDAWEGAFARELTEYYAAIQARLTSQQGFDDLVRLAEARRHQVRDLPIGREFRLLLPETDLPRENLVMTAQGSVVEDVA